MALLFSLMAAAADGLSSDGVLLWDMSESELLGMDERLDEDGNWLRMFPVSSLIWVEKRWVIFTPHQWLMGCTNIYQQLQSVYFHPLCVKAH